MTEPLNLEGLAARLPLERGITAIVGGGGKTTVLEGLGRILSRSGSVIVTTSTHIFPPDGIRTASGPEEIREILERDGICCAGRAEPGTGKLVGPGIPFPDLERMADYVLVEADGARRLPLKAPGDREPVIPAGTRLVIAVAGLDGIGKPVRETCFRPERYAGIAGCAADDPVRPEDAAAVLSSPQGQRKNLPEGAAYAVVLNKADTEFRIRQAEQIRDLLTADGIRHIYITRLKEEF